MDKLELLQEWIEENIKFLDDEINTNSYRSEEEIKMKSRIFAYLTVLEQIEVLNKIKAV